MPLDPGDPYYLAEDISPTIAAMEHPLCDAFGVGLDHFGSKGNENHLSGYHRSRNWILNSPDSAHGSGDYSIQLGLDHGNNDDIAAFDFTPGVWGSSDNRARMKVITRRVIEAMQAHDPRVANLREFAGTLDGSHVVTYDQSRNAFKTPFDSSHLDHIHGSIYRSKTRADHSGIVAVLLGDIDEGDDDMFLRSPNGSIYLVGGGKTVSLSLTEWQALSPDQTFVNAPQSLIDKLTAPDAPVQATLSEEQFADFKAGVVPIVHDAAQTGAQAGAAAALDGATIHPAAS